MANPQTTELLQRKSELIQSSDAILQKAADEQRFDLLGDEEKQFTTIHDELTRINKHLERIAQQASYGESEGRHTEPPNPGTNQEQRRERERVVGRITEADRIEAFRAWALAGSR